MDTGFVTEKIELPSKVHTVEDIVYVNGQYFGTLQEDKLANLVTGKIVAENVARMFQGQTTAYFRTLRNKIFEIGSEQPLYTGNKQASAVLERDGLVQLIFCKERTYQIIKNPGQKDETETEFDHNSAIYMSFDPNQGFFAHTTHGEKWIHIALNGKKYEREFNLGHTRRIPKTPILIANEPDEKGYYHATHIRTNKRLVFPTPPQVALGEGKDYLFLSVVHLDGKLPNQMQPTYMGQGTEAIGNAIEAQAQQHAGKTTIPNLFLMRGKEVPTARIEYVHPDELRQVIGQTQRNMRVASRVAVYTKKGSQLDAYIPMLEDGEYIVGCAMRGDHILALTNRGTIADGTGDNFGRVRHEQSIEGPLNPDFILMQFEGGYLTLSEDRKTIYKTTKESY